MVGRLFRIGHQGLDALNRNFFLQIERMGKEDMVQASLEHRVPNTAVGRRRGSRQHLAPLKIFHHIFHRQIKIPCKKPRETSYRKNLVQGLAVRVHNLGFLVLARHVVAGHKEMGTGLQVT